jgi:ribonuclease D
MPNPVFINTPDQLAEYAERWAQAEWLAIDTEFVRVDTYYPILCLIQIGDGRSNACVDTLALKDLAPLLKVLGNPGILKIFHAASQDLEIFVQLTGSVPAPLFDSQTAATLLGIGDQIGYAGLIEKRLGIAVDKSLSRTDWARRPLKDNEIAYAADDVRHLAVVYPALRDELAACGRLAWLEEDCARVCDPAQYLTRPEDAWERLKGLQRLKPVEQIVAARLAAWRETQAQQRNRPRKWIVEDDAIYGLAQRQPASRSQLEGLGLLQPKTLERHADSLLALIAAARAEPAMPLALVEEFTSAQTALLKRLQDQLQKKALELRLPASYIAPRADLGRLVVQGAEANIPLLRGWRRAVAGEALLTAL